MLYDNKKSIVSAFVIHLQAPKMENIVVYRKYRF